MKFRIFTLILFLGILFTMSLNAEKVAEFEEFGRPDGLYISNDLIYVQEKVNIYIYNLKDFKFIKVFGKEGEGPGELKINPFGPPLIVTPHKDKLYISSMAKLSIFSKTGDFIKEFKVNTSDSFSPFGDAYVCLSTEPSDKDKQKKLLAYFFPVKNYNRGHHL